MAKPEKVESYLQEMTFKKKGLGGIDELDVLEHIQAICNLYDEELENGSRTGEDEEAVRVLTEERDALKDENQSFLDTIRKLETENGELKAALERERADEGEALREENRLLAEELDEMKNSLGKQQETALAMKAEYEKKYDEIKALSAYIPQIQEDARAKADKEAQDIVGLARQEAEELRQRSEQERMEAEEEIARIRQSKESLKESFRESLSKYDSLIELIRADADDAGD